MKKKISALIYAMFYLVSYLGLDNVLNLIQTYLIQIKFVDQSRISRRVI